MSFYVTTTTVTTKFIGRVFFGVRNQVGVRMTQQQNDTVCHFGMEGHFGTGTK